MRLTVWILLILAPIARAQFPTTRPYDGVEYQHEQRRNPEQSLHILKIDLSDPKVNLRLATAGDDPDGPGPWQTTLQPVPQIAERERFDITINASFFEIGPPSTTRPTFAPDMPARSVGWTMIDGRVISPSPRDGWPIVWIAQDKRVRMGAPKELPRDARQIVTGNGMVLVDGKPAPAFEGNLIPRHPRTVLGIDREGKTLTILILDGRRAGVASGMTGPELAIEMLRLGSWNAINLDGGGSTTLVMRDPVSGEYNVVNQPSDNRPRAVSSAIGITISVP